ncbi:MAG: hypothetical protein FWC73_13865 [Defluviitaleaceae bacterium]|nr:hypothetical protein [Defluviitaleaceae bacterium]
MSNNANNTPHVIPGSTRDPLTSAKRGGIPAQGRDDGKRMLPLINSALYLEQLKRFWPIAAISMLGYLIFVVQVLYFSPLSVNPGRNANQMLELLTMNHPAIVISMVAVPFCAALALFAYPYRGASATAYHALPINRMQLFFTHIAAGLTLILVPLFLLSIILLAPVTWHSQWTYFGRDRIILGETINTLWRVTGFFLRNAMGFTMYFAIFVLAASLAGNRVIGVILSGVIVFAPMGFVGLAEVIGSYYIFGFGGVSLGVMENVAVFTNPVGWMTAYEGWGAARFAQAMSHAPFFISYGLIAIGAFGLAFIGYKLRPHERAGDTVAFLPVKRVLIFLFSLAGMVIMGVFWLNASGNRLGYYSGFVVGFIIAYFIAQMMAEKTFRIGHKVKDLVTYGAVAVGLYVMLLLVTGVGFWGYVRRVPEAQEITGVHIEQFRFQGIGANDDHFFINDPATIARVHEIHEAIVANRGYLQRSRWNRSGVMGGVWSWWTAPFHITYRLADGSTMHRSYILTSNFHSNWDINDLMNSRPVIAARNPALLRPEVIESIGFNVHMDHGWRLFNEVDLARIEADAQGVDVEYILGDRAEILTQVYQLWRDVRMPEQLAQLAPLILADMLYQGEDRNWNSSITINLRIRNQYAHYNWGGGWGISVPIDGYAAQWLMDNRFIPGVLVEDLLP